MEISETGKEIAKKLKFKMFDVLTDEQMERMAELIDNPPDYIKKMSGRLKANTTNGQDGQWKPDENSWKPGDAIPEEYLEQRKERKKNFPKKQ